MLIRFQCPGCEKKLTAKDDFVGKRVKCPGCGQLLVVPRASSASVQSSTTTTPPVKPLTQRSRQPTIPPIPDSRLILWPWYLGGGAAALCIVAVMVIIFAVPGKDRSSAKNELAALTPPEAKPEPKSEPKPEPKLRPGPREPVAAAPLVQHIKSLRVVLAESYQLPTENVIKRIHALYEPLGVKIVVGNITESSPLKEDAILVMTYAQREQFRNSVSHEVTYVWIDARQQFLVTANSIKDTSFGAFGTPYGLTEKLDSSFLPPLFLKDVHSCVTSHQTTDHEQDGLLAFLNEAVTSDDGNYLFYVETLYPSEDEKKLGKKKRWELRVLDTKQGKVVGRQPCLGDKLFLCEAALCCFGEAGLETFDTSKLPTLSQATSLFAGKKVAKVAPAGQFLCVLVEERLHVLDTKPRVREVSVDDAPTASFWTGPTGQVWMLEALPKDAKRVADLRLGRLGPDGKVVMEGKTDLVAMGDGETVASGYGPHFALNDKWAVSIAPSYSKSALRLYDLNSGKPKLVQKVEGVAGKDIILSEGLCAVLDDSVLRFFSIADPKKIQRVGDVPLGKKVPAQVVGIKDLSLVNFALLLQLQSLNSRMRQVDDQIVAHCAGAQINKEGTKNKVTTVYQIHRLQLAPFGAPAP